MGWKWTWANFLDYFYGDLFHITKPNICWRWNIPKSWVMWNIGAFINRCYNRGSLGNILGLGLYPLMICYGKWDENGDGIHRDLAKWSEGEWITWKHLETLDRSTGKRGFPLETRWNPWVFRHGFCSKSNLESLSWYPHDCLMIFFWILERVLGLDKLYNRLWNLESFPIFHSRDHICWKKKILILDCSHETMDHDHRYGTEDWWNVGHETVLFINWLYHIG